MKYFFISVLFAGIICIFFSVFYHFPRLGVSYGITMIAGQMKVLGDPEFTANIYCKSRNLPYTDTQNFSTHLR